MRMLQTRIMVVRDRDMLAVDVDHKGKQITCVYDERPTSAGLAADGNRMLDHHVPVAQIEVVAGKWIKVRSEMNVIAHFHQSILHETCVDSILQMDDIAYDMLV